VPRVLIGIPFVSTAMRDEVSGSVREVGYVPNAQAMALRIFPSGAIGIVTSEIQNPPRRTFSIS